MQLYDSYAIQDSCMSVWEGTCVCVCVKDLGHHFPHVSAS